MFDITFLNKADKESVLPQLFHLLCENMSQIAPIGNTSEQDLKIWMSYIAQELENKGREILLIKCGNSMVGYFKYSIEANSLFMEDIQFYREYWGSGAFAELYSFLASIIPDSVTGVTAYANKENQKSRAILEHLGLNIVGENKSSKCYLYSGSCRTMLEKYRTL